MVIKYRLVYRKISVLSIEMENFLLVQWEILC